VVKNLAYVLYILLFVVTCLFVVNHYLPSDPEPYARISYVEYEQGHL
jgi:hypothetical protein